MNVAHCILVGTDATSWALKSVLLHGPHAIPECDRSVPLGCDTGEAVVRDKGPKKETIKGARIMHKDGPSYKKNNYSLLSIFIQMTPE